MKKLKQYLRDSLPFVSRKRYESELDDLLARLAMLDAMYRGLVRNVAVAVSKAEENQIGKLKALKTIESHIMTAWKHLMEAENAHV